MKLRKAIAWVVLCCVSMVHAESLDRVVALVNDNVITEHELDEKVLAAEEQMRARKISPPDIKIVRKQVLEQLIHQDLQLQLAKANHIEIEDDELNTAIERIARSNRMSTAELKSALQKEGVTWEEYKKTIRSEMVIHHLQQKTIAKDIHITNEHVDDYLKANASTEKSHQKYIVETLIIPLPEEPTSDELTRASEKAKALLTKGKNGGRLESLSLEESGGEWLLKYNHLGERDLAELPELYSKEIQAMKAGEIRGPLRAGNGFHVIKLVEIKGGTSKHIVRKTKVRHILIKPDSGTTATEAKKKVHNLYQQLKSGKSFAVFAKKYSADLGNAGKGGDLGWVTDGQLVPEFEKVMNALKVKEISQPVKSVFGWHIIQVLERKKVDDTVAWKKKQVREFLFQRKMAEAVQTWQQHLRAEAYVKVLDKDLA